MATFIFHQLVGSPSSSLRSRGSVEHTQDISLSTSLGKNGSVPALETLYDESSGPNLSATSSIPMHTPFTSSIDNRSSALSEPAILPCIPGGDGCSITLNTGAVLAGSGLPLCLSISRAQAPCPLFAASPGQALADSELAYQAVTKVLQMRSRLPESSHLLLVEGQRAQLDALAFHLIRYYRDDMVKLSGLLEAILPHSHNPAFKPPPFILCLTAPLHEVLNYQKSKENDNTVADVPEGLLDEPSFITNSKFIGSTLPVTQNPATSDASGQLIEFDKPDYHKPLQLPLPQQDRLIFGSSIEVTQSLPPFTHENKPEADILSLWRPHNQLQQMTIETSRSCEYW
ncbi:unnamed protein product [Protopolystoma xenopodis]|uniref:Uncharacterized protein n=1 Tax=Protopolystoma xenopodis TaxID=117903 RepID=A0A448X282_9PLAT|nr:unnamed protein product [Protopolystoma xenopodis]